MKGTERNQTWQDRMEWKGVGENRAEWEWKTCVQPKM